MQGIVFFLFNGPVQTLFNQLLESLKLPKV